MNDTKTQGLEGVVVFEIGTPERAEPVLREKLARGERLMGFGHRVYRVRDPRADVLAAAAERFYRNGGDMGLYELARSVEATALRLLREAKPDRRLDTNVEFYTAPPAPRPGIAHRAVHPHLRHRPRRRLDGPRPRTARHGPAHPAAVGVRGGEGTAVGGGGGAGGGPRLIRPDLNTFKKPLTASP